jgi:hypothetical protein
MIITFYSYDGNVGCTATATNVGILLSRKFAKKTLIVNWNFELGTTTPLTEICPVPEFSLLRIASDYKTMLDGYTPLTQQMLNHLTTQVNPTSVEELFYLPALSQEEATKIRHALFDWPAFYESYDGGLLIEFLKNYWKAEYDAVLIISERGFSPAAAICTMQLPDAIVILMEIGYIDSSAHITGRIVQREKDNSRRTIWILPMLSKVDNSEIQLCINTLKEMRNRFSKYLPPQLDPAEYFETAVIPNVPYYAQSQGIAVIEERSPGLVQSYMELTKKIVTLNTA